MMFKLYLIIIFFKINFFFLFLFYYYCIFFYKMLLLNKIISSSSAKYKYVYLTWTYNLLDVVLSESTKTTKPAINSLMKSQSLLLEKILLDESASESIKKQSIKVARKVVIKKKRLGVETYLNYALNNEGKNWALILGLAVDVAVRKNWKDIIEEKKV